MKVLARVPKALILAMVLAGLYFASNLGIVVGYYNFQIGFQLLAIELVYEHVPALKASTYLTCFLPINVLVAFFLARGNYKNYRVNLYVLSYLTPFLVLLVLPGATEKPPILGLNLTSMFVVLVGAQLAGAYALDRRAWEFATDKDRWS